MSISKEILIIVLGCSLVTWVPRIAPFILAKTIKFPKKILKFLEFLPICILSSLLLQSVLISKDSGFPIFDVVKTFALIPTLLVAIITKNLMKTVVIGIITIAFIRYLI